MITIVLADHHHLIRQGVRLLLETEKDFEVVAEVADGLKVVGLIERRKPRVLIVASAMPGLNSFEVTLRVRQRAPETAIIVLSMDMDDQYIVEALRSGASGYVVTQAKGSELVRAIRKVAAGDRYLSAPFSDRPWTCGYNAPRSEHETPTTPSRTASERSSTSSARATATQASPIACPSAVARQNRIGRTS